MSRDIVTLDMLDMEQFETAYKRTVKELDEAKKIYDDEMKIELIFNDSGQFRGHVWKATSFYTDEQLIAEPTPATDENGAPMPVVEDLYRLHPDALIAVAPLLVQWTEEQEALILAIP